MAVRHPRLPKVLSSFLAVGACWAPPTIIFARGLFLGHTLFWGDVGITYLPLRWWAVRCLRAQDLPSWCPLIGAGTNMLAEGQGGALYPTNLVSYLLGVPVWWDYTFQCWLHVGLAATFTYLWLRRAHGMSWLASVIAAHTFSLSGYMIGHIMHLPMLQIAAWLPAALWTCELIATGGAKAWRGVGVLAGVVGLGALAGHPQTVWYVVLGAGVWLAAYLRRGAVVGAIGRFSAAVGIGLALGAVQIMPTAVHAAFFKCRRGGDVSFVRKMSLTWRSFANLVHPEIYGSYGDGSYFGGELHWEVCAWTGGAALLLALVAAASGRRRRLRTAALVLVPVALFFALARYNPAYRILAWIPPLGMFRAAGRYVVLVTMGVGVLAAVGVEELSLSKLARKAALRVGLVVLVGWLAAPHLIRAATPILRPVLIREALVRSGGDRAVAAAKTAEKMDFFLRRTSPTDPYVAIWLLTAAALVGAGAAVARNAVFGRAALGLCVATGLAHLMLLGYWYYPWLVEPEVLRAGVWTRAEAMAAGWNGSGYFWVEPALPVFASKPKWRPDDPGGIALWATGFFSGLHRSSNVLAGVGCIKSTLPLAPLGLIRLTRLLAHGMERQGDVLAALGVAAVITTRDKVESLGAVSIRPAPALGQDVVLCVLRDAPQALAWVPEQVRFVGSNDEAIEEMCGADFRWTTAVVEGREGLQTSQTNGRGSVVAAAFRQTGGFDAEVNMVESGWVVIAAAYDPGWRVWVDGRRARLYRANALISALRLSPGHHRIVMRYYCPGLVPGLLLSVLGIGLVGAVLWQARCESIPASREAPAFRSR